MQAWESYFKSGDQGNEVVQQTLKGGHNMDFTERLKNFPISFFSIILGMSGFTLAYQRAEHILKLPFEASGYLLWVTGVLFALVSVLYVLKIFIFTDKFKAELNHPVRINFFPLLAKIFLVNAIIFLTISKTVSMYLWIAGSASQLFFSII